MSLATAQLAAVPRSPVRAVPLSPAIGADVVGLDLDNLTAEAFLAMRQALLDHCVIRLRGYDIDDAKQVEIARMFGAPVKSSVARAKGTVSFEEFPELFVISNVKENGVAIGELGDGELNWHTDLAFDEVPPSLSMLRALEVPASGGNTGFANMYKAYDGLSPRLKQRIAGLKIKHQYSHDAQGKPRLNYEHVSAADVRELPGPIHPIVRTHPDSLRKALYLGRRFGGYVMGLPVADSEALLDELWHWGTLPENHWHQQWQVGDMMVWDNRCTMHRRDPFPGTERRRMHRIVVMGSKPI
ncbi:MAG TPA: TauD/TfdA family dioxygenase [Geminicoccaceae bacterium]|nr:TauD/TfdA family dioxygenase [Geminicoccus sp.]HMU51725.1 TauD/TfdA family dioxygenase [Geminicoccaceae bacterium]